MSEALRVIVEMNECVWKRFKNDLQDLTPEEADWRPLPQANSISLILRHLCIDVLWHAQRVGQSPVGQPPDAAPHSTAPTSMEFVGHLLQLETSYARLIAGLRATTLRSLEECTVIAYQGGTQGPPPAHFLGYHFALHLAAHGGQIRTVRNLYAKTRGAPARFFPDNPTFPA